MTVRTDEDPQSTVENKGWLVHRGVDSFPVEGLELVPFCIRKKGERSETPQETPRLLDGYAPVLITMASAPLQASIALLVIVTLFWTSEAGTSP
jgi:hypothetical protein